jgi:hypothetical protein
MVVVFERLASYPLGFRALFAYVAAAAALWIIARQIEADHPAIAGLCWPIWVTIVVLGRMFPLTFGGASRSVLDWILG